MTPRTPCSNWLPIEPMRRVIQRDAQRLWDAADVEYAKPCKYPGLTLLAHQTGIGERQLRRWLDENAYAEEGAVDRYCCATGRHLFDLFPELDDRPDDEVYSAPCKNCPSTSLVIVREARLRLWLRCLHCGHGQYVNHPKSSKSGPPRRYTPEDDAAMRRLYESGWLIRDIAEHYGCPYTTAATSLSRAGTTMRPRVPPPTGVQSTAWREWRKRRVAEGYQTALKCAELRAQGCALAAIGRELGISKAGVQVALRRLEAVAA